jgi:hypothetical protein
MKALDPGIEEQRCDEIIREPDCHRNQGGANEYEDDLHVSANEADEP